MTVASGQTSPRTLASHTLVGAPFSDVQGSNNSMEHLADLTAELRAAADALALAAQRGTLTLEDRSAIASALDRGRAALRSLTHIGLEPEDFNAETQGWKQARSTSQGRKILANKHGIASQSMFSAADPIVLARDLERVVYGLRAQADDEDALVRLAATDQVA